MSFEGPTFVHWDGKLLHSIDGTKKRAEQIAIIVSRNQIKQFFGVPKRTLATGKEQAMECNLSINDWKLHDKVKGLVIDTTTSKTSLPKGACAIIEKA